MRVLLVYCVLDEPTTYAAFWTRRIGQEAMALGHEVYYLSGSLVTAYGLLGAMEQYQPDLVVLSGHGSAAVFTGAGMQEVLRACTNDQMMAGSHSMFISCLVGLQLVPSIVRKGGLAAQGYVKEFIWMIDGSGNPAMDPYAASFERILVESAVALMKGGSWRDWYQTFHRVCNEEITRWGASDDPVAASVIMCIRQDKSAAVVSGAGSMDGEGGVVSPLPLLAAAYAVMKWV